VSDYAAMLSDHRAWWWPPALALVRRRVRSRNVRPHDSLECLGQALARGEQQGGARRGCSLRGAGIQVGPVSRSALLQGESCLFWLSSPSLLT